MELRQLQYFVKAVELASMGKAALALDVTTSALSQQISRLEGELSTRLLQRRPTGVVPTGAGTVFYWHAEMVLRQVEVAADAARGGRLSGKVNVGLSPTIALSLALPLLKAMHMQHPEIRIHIVEGLTAHLAELMDAHRLDLSIRFDMPEDTRSVSEPLLKEYLFVIGRQDLPEMPAGTKTRLQELGALPLVLPNGRHSLVNIILSAFKRYNVSPNIVEEVDSLNTLMGVVQEGIAATIHPSSAISIVHTEGVRLVPIADRTLFRCSILTSQPDDELSPAALAARVTLKAVVRDLIRSGRWDGAYLMQ